MADNAVPTQFQELVGLVSHPITNSIQFIFAISGMEAIVFKVQCCCKNSKKSYLKPQQYYKSVTDYGLQ